MPLVPAHFTVLFAQPLADRGLPLEDWIAGIPVSAEQILEPGTPIEYSSVVALFERAAQHLGSYDDLERMAFEIDPSLTPRGMDRLRRVITTPGRMYSVSARHMADQVSPPFHVQIEGPEHGRVVIDLWVDEDVPASQAIWYQFRGMMRRVPLQFGLPPAEIVSTLEERHARFEIRYRNMPLWSRGVRTMRRLIQSREMIRDFQAQQSDLQRTINQLQVQSAALLESERRNRELVEQLEHVVAERTSELEMRSEQLREVQAQLIQAERLGAAQELAGSVAHSINNPLTALIGQLQMVLESSKGSDPRVERAHQAALRIRDVVTRTLQLFRQGELDLASEDPQQVLADVAASLGPLAERDQVQLELKCEPGIPPLDADAALLRAALGSLVENAIEASQPGGVVQLELASVPSLRVIEFRIGDAGPGIVPQMRRKVLEPFFTTKPGGTGLGLAIAQGVVAGHHGRLRLLPRPGGGTVVTAELPLAADSGHVGTRTEG